MTTQKPGSAVDDATKRTQRERIPPRAIPLRRENSEIIRTLWNCSVEELKAWGDRGCPGIKRLPSESANGSRLVAVVKLVDNWLESLPVASAATPAVAPGFYTTTSTSAETVPLPRGRVTRSLTESVVHVDALIFPVEGDRND